MIKNENEKEGSISMYQSEKDDDDKDHEESLVSELFDYEFLHNFYLESKRRKAYISHRKPMNQVQFDEEYDYRKLPRKRNKLKKNSQKFITRYYTPFTSISNFGAFLISLVPCLEWLPKYNYKNDLTADLTAGITIGVLHVPQGIAYAVISKQEPIVGLYSSMFPALIYMIFGTSKHASIGSFAVVALITGIAVARESFIPEDEMTLNESGLPTPLEISCCLTLTAGIVQFLMGFLQFQFFTTYLSDQVVGGFTTGAAIHVFVAQFKELFGFKKLPKYSGPGYLFKVIASVMINILNSNWMSCIISFSTIVFLLLGKEYVNPWLKRKTNKNNLISWELLAVILSTLFVFLIDGDEAYGVRVVKEIPTGIPSVSIPRFDLIPRILPDAISIAVVSVVVHLSLSKMIAKRKEYEIDPGQELFALSVTSIGSSFLPVYPVSCALGRTMVGLESGVSTQLYNFFSSMLVFSVLMFFGRFLGSLPMCVLSAIILVALKGMLKKVGDLQGLWRMSKIDFWIWVVAFVATVSIDVSEGLVIAIMFALFTTILREQYPKWQIISNVNGTIETQETKKLQETFYLNGICIFKFEAPLIFLNVECFKKCVEKAYNDWKKSEHFNVSREENGKNLHDVELGLVDQKNEAEHRDILPRHFVIDCSGITSVDLMGVNALKDVFSEMRKRETFVHFANTKVPVREMFEKCNFYGSVSKDNCYPTLRDAIAVVREQQLKPGLNNPAYIPDHDELLQLMEILPNN